MLAKLWKSQAPKMVGIDIGSNCAKAVLISKVAHGYQVDGFALETLPDGAIVENEIRDIAAVGDTLRRLKKRLPSKQRTVAVALPGSSVMTKVIYMDAGLTDDELSTQIEIEADNLIPYPLDEVNIDFEIQGSNRQDPSQVDILLSACRTEHVEARTASLDVAKLDVKVVDVEGYALGRALSLQLGQLPITSSDPCVAMVDIGATLITLSVVERGETIFTQQQAFGGAQYTQMIADHYGMRVAEAEQNKLANNLPAGYQMDVLANFQSAMMQQIRRLLQMFYATHNRNQVDHLVLAGGCTLLRDLDQMVADDLQIPTTLANPFAEMVISDRLDRLELQQQAPRFMVAAGLAMRSYGPWRT